MSQYIECIEKFKLNLMERDLSDAYCYSSEANLHRFFKWFNQDDINAVTPLDIKEYKRKCIIEDDSASGTINTRLIILKNFYKWANDNKYCVANPCQDIKLLKEVEKPIKWLDRQQLYKLIRQAMEEIQLAKAKNLKPTTEKSIRNFAQLSLMIHAGLRVSEVRKLKLSDITINERSGIVRIRHSKGGKSREVPLNLDVRQALNQWLDIRDNANAVFLFHGTNREQQHQRTIQYNIERLGKRAGLERKLTPHMLRHTFCKNLIDQNVSIDRVARLAGHANVNTTAIYTRPSQADLAEAVDRISWFD